MTGASSDIWEIMSTARTIRRFTDEPVDDATLARCLEAARWAPSPVCRVRQPRSLGRAGRGSDGRHLGKEGRRALDRPGQLITNFRDYYFRVGE